MDEIRIGEKTYISSKRAAEVTGYAKDYVGQLCREGHVEAKMVGRSWYVFEPSIREHRFGKEIEPVVASEEVTSDVLVAEDEPATLESAVSKVEIAPADEVLPEAEPTLEQWERPTYKPEPVYTIPAVQNTQKVIAERPINALESPEYRHILEESSLTDMQKAWKEWFDHKQTGVQKTTDQIEEVAEDDEIEEEIIEVEQENTDEVTAEMEDEETESTFVPIRTIEPSEPLQSDEKEDTEEFHIPVRKIVPAPNYEASEGHIVSERVIQKHVFATVPMRANRSRLRPKSKNKASIILRAILVGISLVAVSGAVIGAGMADQYLKTIPTENPGSKLVEVLTGQRTINNK